MAAATLPFRALSILTAQWRHTPGQWSGHCARPQQPDFADRCDGLFHVDHRLQTAGKVDLSNVSSQPSGRIHANAQGTNSIIDFSKLPELLSDAEYDSELEVGTGGSILTGALATLNRGDLQLDDNQSSVTTSHITSITSSNLYVYGGGNLAFPALSNSHSPMAATLLANGVGTVLDLSSLISLTGATGYSTLTIDAQTAGKVDLSNVSSQPSGRIYANAQGTNSIIDFSKLPELLSDAEYDSELEVGTGGSILTECWPRSIAVICSSMTINRRSPPATSRPSPRRTSTSTAAATLPFRALQFSQPNGATLLANGAGTVLDLSSLISLTGATGYSTLTIDAQAAGKVDLSNVSSQPSGRIYANAQGTNSIIDFSKLPELLSDAEYDSELEAGTGGSILTECWPRSIAVICSSMTINRRSPPATSRPSPRRTCTSMAAATLPFRALSILTAQWRHTPGQWSGHCARPQQPDFADRCDGLFHVDHRRADAGKVDLSNVSSQPSGRIYANAQGTNSIIDLSKLPELQSDAEYDSELEAGSGGSILTESLATLNRGDLQLDDNQSSITTSNITSITSSNLYVYGGGDLAFPALSQFSQPNGATLLANGAGSVLDLSSLTSLVGATGYGSLNFDVQAGGRVDLSNVSSQPSGRIYANAQGTNSIIDFSKLPELLSDAEYDSELEAGTGGSILTGALATLNRGDLQLDDNQSSITTSQITSITSSNLYVYGGGDLAFPALSQFSQSNGATLLANGAGSVLDLSSLTSLAGATGYGSLNFERASWRYGQSQCTVELYRRMYPNHSRRHR